MSQVLLLVAFIRHYAWPWFPVELQGMASKGFGSLAILCLLVAVWLHSDRSKWLAAVLLWWSWEEAQTLLCSAVYMLNQWSVPPGVPICSAVVGLDLGAIGLVVAAVLAYVSTCKR